MSDVVIQAKLRVTRSATRESSLQLTFSWITRPNRGDGFKGEWRYSWILAVIPQRGGERAMYGKARRFRVTSFVNADRWADSVDFAALSRFGLGVSAAFKSRLLISLIDASTTR